MIKAALTVGLLRGRRKSPEEEEDRVESSRDGNDLDSIQPELDGISIESDSSAQRRILPIISGMLCPFSVLLDIPGLTERWYVKTYGYDVILTVPNTPLLDIAIIGSLIFGVMANVCLISRFLEKKARLATLLAITCLTIHDIINLITVLDFGIIHRIDDGFTYGEAYWMTVAATVASIACNITLIIDFKKTKDFKHHGSGLSEKQRSLVIIVMVLLCYIALGSMVFSFLLSYSYLDSLYFTICTVTSVGFGDLTPFTESSRIFSFFYDTFGLILIGLTIAIGRETVIDAFEAGYRKRREQLAIKARERKEIRMKRLQERKIRRFHDAAELDHETHETHDEGDGVHSYVKVESFDHNAGAFIRRSSSNILDYEEEKEFLAPGVAYLRLWLRRLRLISSYKPGCNDPEKKSLSINRTLTEQSIIQEKKFHSFKDKLRKEQQLEFQIKITISLLLFSFFWLAGGGVFTVTEKWTYFEALYFCYVFFTTIGYGDLSPKSSAGRAFFICWSILGVGVMTLVLSVLTESWSSRFHSTITSSKMRKTLKSIIDRRPSRVQELITPNEYSLETLPEELLACLKSFHNHAKYFLNGRTGDVPVELRGLIDTMDSEELMKLQEDSELTGARKEAHHFLFLMSYEKRFDALTEVLSATGELLRSHAKELQVMQTMNEELRLQLESRSRTNSLEKGEDTHFFLSSSPGGSADEETEKELVKEIDGLEEDEPPSTLSSTLLSEPHSTYRRASTTIVDISQASAERYKMKFGSNLYDSPTPSRRSSILDLSASSIPSPPPVITRPRSKTDLSISRTPTLTFKEPEVVRERQGSTSIRDLIFK